MPTKIVHVIVGLDVGGAETMLYRLLRQHRNDPDISHAVISLTSLGAIGHKLEEIGVSVTVLHLPHGLRAMVRIGRIVSAIAATQPDIVQTWMYHADLLGGIAARRAGVPHVVWNIRNTLVPGGVWSLTAVLAKICGISSRWIPDKIICCAEAARERHIALGYDASKMIVVPNGIDTHHFQFKGDLRAAARVELGIADNQPLIGIIGRFDELKDFPTFIDGMRIVAAKFSTARFLMIGRGINWTNDALISHIDRAGLTSHVLLMDEIADVRFALAAMDVFCLSSKSEGFPNVLIEAMAMERPCVSTSAGDAALILDPIAQVVAPSDAAAMGRGVVDLLKQSIGQRAMMGSALRARVEDQYSVARSAERYRACYKALVLGK